ncbi:MAG: VOC family protein [Pelagimonas sp.]|nr:VOC family protein [Pelagimonas sp.]
MPAILEHANITVSDIRATAQILVDLFDWTIRWEGASIHDGYSMHVGGENSYLALYTPKDTAKPPIERYVTAGSLCHLAVTVDDLDVVEARVKAAGLEPHSHADYEPGRRFYFMLPDEIEIEVVSYD